WNIEHWRLSPSLWQRSAQSRKRSVVTSERSAFDVSWANVAGLAVMAVATAKAAVRSSLVMGYLWVGRVSEFTRGKASTGCALAATGVRGDRGVGQVPCPPMQSPAGRLLQRLCFAVGQGRAR